MSHNIGFVSLGCPKATVDSERILTQLQARGYQTVNSYQDADLVVINTCGFIQSAIDESLQTIRQAMHENGKVLVTGCLGKRADWLRQQEPNILGISGPANYETVVQQVLTHLPPPDEAFSQLLPPQGLKLTPRHYAYLKISEGCNHTCSFCIIPQMRGRLHSRPMDAILHEAEQLANAGVQELLIVSQDTGAYGSDAGYPEVIWQEQRWRSDLPGLVAALNTLGIWVRLHYLYPYPHIERLLPLLHPRGTLPYLDLPLQHASAKVLRTMRRPAQRDRQLERLQAWRKTCPDLVLRSTFITGFPGETEQDFTQLLDFLTEAQLDRVGCFPYSPVQGATANQLPNPVPEELREERAQRLMAHQADISHARLQRRMGQRYEVLVDEVLEHGAVARSYAEAPEVDGVIMLDSNEGLSSGDMIQARITGHDEHDLQASPCP